MTTTGKAITKRKSDSVIFTAQGGGYYYVIKDGERVGCIKNFDTFRQLVNTDNKPLFESASLREVKVKAIEIWEGQEVTRALGLKELPADEYGQSTVWRVHYRAADVIRTEDKFKAVPPGSFNEVYFQTRQMAFDYIDTFCHLWS